MKIEGFTKAPKAASYIQVRKTWKVFER